MRWTIKPKPEQSKIDTLSEALGVDYLISSLLVQRGIETFEDAKNFFRPSLEQLHDPFLMKDMDKALARIQKAIENNENILIFGDYDVDGTTAVSLVFSYLRTFYPNVATYIPDRYEEGYGVSHQSIDFAEDNNISLIIALDCGIKAVKQVAYASKKHIDFIICDHHNPSATLPEAVAILNPKQHDCNYPYKELCGCGVGFKLIQAIASTKNQTIEDLVSYLDLVAAAIAADIVPITQENRILAYFGLQQLRSNPRVGIKAIIHQVEKQIRTISDVVFIVAPRINAAGRIKHGQHAVHLLTETNEANAKKLANEIEEYNQNRKKLDEKITIEALQQIEEKNEQENAASVVYSENWHKGVIGIVASRLMETHYRPTLVFTKSKGKLTASARSVKDFDVYAALETCSEHMIQFGGHKYAAGLTIEEENYTAFKQKFEEVVASTLDKNLCIQEITADASLDVTEITPKFYRILKQFAPFGPGNRNPIFISERVKDVGYGKTIGKDHTHLKVNITQKGSKPINGIGFNLGKKLETITNKNPFDVVYSIEENEWNGKVSLQLKIKDIKEPL